MELCDELVWSRASWASESAQQNSQANTGDETTEKTTSGHDDVVDTASLFRTEHFSDQGFLEVKQSLGVDRSVV